MIDSAGTAGFKDGNNAGDDYAYDANGNMTQNLNKGITSVEYNHLNLPTRVDWEAGRYQLTTYDANGIKLQQKQYNADTLTKTTDYVGEFIYETVGEGDRELQLIQHEEGRIIPKDGAFDYQYHLKDHLGNVRVTFSTTPENYEMVETFESGENNGFQDLHRATNSNANTTSGGDEVSLLQSGETGAMVFLSMNKGDTVDLTVNANYESAPSNNNFLGTAYGALFSSFDAVYGSGIEGGVSSSSTVFDDALNGIDMSGKGNSSTAPRAFLNYIFFDREMNYVKAGFLQITTAAQGIGVIETISLQDIIADQEGYILAYLSNENQEAVNVHFDDFTVYHGKTNVVQSQAFYPFGGEFNNYQRTASSKDRFIFNQGTGDKTFKTERNYELGVDMTKYRVYDYWAVRFWQVDPKADVAGQESWTPYQYGFNNPIRYNDPLGDCIPCLIPQVTATYAGLKAKYSGIASKAVAPTQRLMNGTSGDVPSNVNMDSRTRSTMKIAGTASDVNKVAETGKELGQEAVMDTGEVLDKGGEIVSDIGVALAPVTEGASLALVPVGEGMSLAGKGMKASVHAARGNTEGVKKEAINAGVQIVTNGLTGAAVKQSVKVGTIKTVTEEVTQKTALGGVSSVANKATSTATENTIDEKEQ